jgi:hypothetical protein
MKRVRDEKHEVLASLIEYGILFIYADVVCE